MHLVVLLLLVLALTLLVLGLISSSTPLVVASIVASLVAAYAMVKYRRGLQPSGAVAAATIVASYQASEQARATAEAVEVPPAEPPTRNVQVESGDADDPADSEPAIADTEPPLRSRGDQHVWVINGRPRYHLASCGFLLHRRPETEPVPLRQAFEDGFTPCALCDPDTGLAGSMTATTA